MLDDRRLAEIGEAISDGTPIDWDAVPGVESDDDREILRELRVLAAIVDVHRQLSPPAQFGLPAGESETITQVWEEHWGHLRLLEKIGYGAFGDVYRAWDTRLDCEVALKLLRQRHSSAASASSSVIEEGRLLARVRHPNVVTVFGAERLEGRVGVWMEYIRGRTLEELVREHGVFGAREAMLIGVDLCRALSAVHRAGLFHRDIKAQNVMRQEGGRIVLMDFGTGREQSPDGSEPVRDFAGTPVYLAPEVIRGQPASAQSDIYSLGVVLFRLVTGAFPVTGRTLRDVGVAHDRGARTTLTDLRPDLPDAFVQVIQRAIAPDLGVRFVTPGTMEQALSNALALVPATESGPTTAPEVPAPRRWRWSATLATALLLMIAVVATLMVTGLIRPPRWAGGAPPSQRIGVLPFVNQSREPGQDYLADGVTDLLATSLSSIGSLSVTSGTTMRRYKETKLAVEDIAKERGLDFVVEGSVAREGDVVLLTVRLIRATTDAHSWGQTYKRTVRDVLAFQGEVAREIANAIAIKLTPRQKQQLVTAPPVSQQAQEAYLRGRAALAGPTTADAEMSVKLLQEAVNADPGYALAHADLADAYIKLGDRSGIIPRAESYSRAKEAALRSIELNQFHAGAHAALARAAFYFDWDWSAADASFRRALDLNPSHADAHMHYSMFLAAQQRLDEAVQEARRARDLDPMAMVRTTTVAAALYYSRRYPEAINELITARTIDPEFVTSSFGLGRTYSAIGRFDEAIASLERSLLPGREVQRVAELARVYAEAGRRADALRLLEEIRIVTSTSTARVTPNALAYVHIAFGETDRAFELLNQAADDRSTSLLWLKVDPRVDSIRSDPRFAGLLARLGLK